MPIRWTWSLCCLSLLLLASCETVSQPRPDSPPRSTVEELSDRQLWSPTVHYHGVKFRFELDPTAEGPQRMAVLPGQAGDQFSIGTLTIAFEGGRFRIGSRRVSLAGSEVVWILRAPTKERPFWLSIDGFRLRWPGNGSDPVVQQDFADGSRKWLLGGSDVTLRSDGIVEFHRLGEDHRWRTPLDLDLDPRGRIVGDGRSSGS